MLKNIIVQGDDDGWRRFLPFIVLMVMYGLSSLFKNKQKKRPPARKPDPSQTKQPTRTMPSAPAKPTIQRSTRLPSYARNRTADGSKTSPKPSQVSRPAASQPKARPSQGKPVPKPRPVERHGGEIPELPMSKPRMQRPAATPANSPEQVRRTAPSSVKPATQTSKHIQAEKKPRTTGQRLKPARTSTSAKTAAKALHSRHQHVKSPVEAMSLTATERLVHRTSRKGVLSQAILYGEILGTPMALRPAGSHSYATLGSSGTGR